VSEAYPWLKILHILSATVLFGTGLGTALHFWLTHLRGDAREIASAARNAVLVDWLCTATSGVVQPISGAALIWLGGHDPWAPWLVAAYALYALAAICWFPVAGLQIRMRDLATEAAARGAALPDAYHRSARIWFALGWPAFLALLAVFALMVMRPEF
jgi:uncharacterized membrane protein